MKMVKIYCPILMFLCFTFSAYAEDNVSVKPVPVKNAVSHFYLDVGFGAIIPTGGYSEYLDSYANLKFQPGFSADLSIAYYFNNYVGISATLQTSLSDTESYLNTGVYLESVQITVGAGLALRYRISKYFEIFGDAGVAYSDGIAKFNVANLQIPEYSGTVAFYGDAGFRLFFRPGYVFAKIKYQGGPKGSVDYLIGKVDLSAFSVLFGIGVTF